MYQFFTNEELEIGKIIKLDSKDAHHAGNVLRLHNKKVRIVNKGIAYFGNGYQDKKDFFVEILEKDDSPKETSLDIYLAISLIRKEKLELVLQKATELGVKKIIPFSSSRSIIHFEDKKKDKIYERWNTILLEASSQCKRNLVPELEDICKINDLKKYKREQNFIAYENADYKSSLIQNCIKKKSSLLVIGPEGGFSDDEVRLLVSDGFINVSLGSRILRAETAAIYGISVIVSSLEKIDEI